MAKFKFDGVDSISASLDQLANLSEEEKFSIIRPAAELLKKAYVEKIQSLFTQRTGALAGSITYNQQSINGNAAMHLYLKGKHPGSSTGKRKRKDGRSNGKYSGTNAEVGYILEHGSPRIAATHWMENTNEEQADSILASQEEQWDNLLTSKGL